MKFRTGIVATDHQRLDQPMSATNVQSECRIIVAVQTPRSSSLYARCCTHIGASSQQQYIYRPY
eukprot:scaffold31370_cov30-Prasinocladus_malaysianus.AAC.1